jgi:hypothetical protein
VGTSSPSPFLCIALHLPPPPISRLKIAHTQFESHWTYPSKLRVGYIQYKAFYSPPDRPGTTKTNKPFSNQLLSVHFFI